MNSDRGVITAANDKYAPTLEALALSLQEQQVPLAVVDHGLGPALTRRLMLRGVQILHTQVEYSTPLEVIAQNSPKRHVHPQLWLKPLICKQSPFAHSLWIDADAVSLRRVEELFKLGDFITRDHFVSQEWAVETYSKVTRALRYQLNKARCRVNSGVFGFYRSSSWLTDWANRVDAITRSKRILRACFCVDQSALVAMLSMPRARVPGLMSLPKIMDNPELNYPVDGFTQLETKSRICYSADPVVLLTKARKRHPDQLVVHWMGPDKNIGC